MSFALCVPTIAKAQMPVGTALSGMRGLVYTELPMAPRELNLSVSGGYGITEPYAPVHGVHQRAQGTLGAAITPLPWLTLALRFDGRLEMHPNDYDGAHVAGFGDPRLFARIGHELSPELSLGFELGAWFPGNKAPSFVASSTSLDARGLIAYTPLNSPWVVLGTLGFRWDNSANSAPDLSRLRLGDRISLGLSDSNALLFAVGVARHMGDKTELFAELSADALVGSSAPTLWQSPLRAALGGRYFIDHTWQAELSAVTSLSQHPAIAAGDPLVPIEPRFLIVVALRYGVSLDKTAAVVARNNEPGAAPKQTAVAAPSAATGSVVGSLVDTQGEALPDVAVKLLAADGSTRETISDGEGRYAFADVPVGTATLEANAVGFQTQRWDIELQPGAATPALRALTAQSGGGILRGLIRTFRSEPLRAQIEVQNRRGKIVANRESGDDGAFKIELPPGSYRVTISAAHFDKHSRSVQIEANAVSILNVDMREAK